MAFTHGKDTYVSVNGTDMSDFTNSTEIEREADTHDVTTYGNNNGAHRYQGGLTDGTGSLGGIYDNAASGSPRVVLEPLLGDTVTIVYRPEGTGTGLPEKTCSAVLMNYNESAPVADMVTWAVELQIDGAVTTAPQA